MPFLHIRTKNYSSKLLSFFILFQFVIPNLHAQMRQVHLNTVNNDIKKISFFSQKEGFVAFSNWIGYTLDSGRTFAQRPITNGNVNFNGYSVNLTFGFGISGVKAFDQNTILVYGDYGLVPSILTSTNGGSTYTLIYHSQFNSTQFSTGITDMVFPQNNAIGYAVDADRILKTTNQGLSWTVVRTDPDSYFTNLEAVDNNNVFALSTEFASNKLLKTTNGGGSWQTINLPFLPNGKMSYAHFFTNVTGWLSMYDNNNDYSFYKTNDGGNSWTLQNDVIATPFRCKKIKFTDENTGYALTSLYTTYKTLNSGITWEPLPRDNNYSYLGYDHNDLQVINNNQLWAGGGHGFLELSTNSGGTPIPKAYFKIDTAGLWNSNVVNLRNYSRSVLYNCRWLLNGTQISTSYNSSYVHDVNRTEDTISLIVSNGTISDTTIKYQYFYPPVKILSFAPTIAGTGNTVNITGLNFGGAFSVTFGGVPASSFNVLSSTSITAVVGSGASGNVKVLTPTGKDSLVGFTFLPPPTLTSFTPTSATAGTTVTITGTNFTGITNVSFGGIAATSYTVVSSTTITAVAPSGESGSVSVITPGGTASLAGYIALPTILSFDPVQGTEGTVMTINGTSLTGTTSVSIGAVNALSFNVNSSNSITAVVGIGASGNVLVTKPGGSSNLPGFTWVNTPVITAFSPISGPIGTSVTITGSGFSLVPANNTVYFGAVKAAVTASTANTITVSVPLHATFEPISVTCNNLTGYSAMPFLVTFANGGSITANSFLNRTVINMDSGSIIGPRYIDLGDLDGDGKSDLIVSGYRTPSTNSGLYLYRNTSTLSSVSFATPINIGSYNYTASAVEDLDGDGKLDIAIINSAFVSTFLNTSTPGNLSFTAGPVLITGGSLYGFSMDDLDGDGKPDIVTTGTTTNIFRNISNPGSIAFAPSVSYAVDGFINIKIADLNGDRKPELISSSHLTDLISIFKNNCTKGNISFDTTTIPGYSSHLTVGDMDGDGKTDIVSGDIVGSKVAVIRNTSTLSTISFAPPVELISTDVTLGIAVSDLDGDGKSDIAVGTYNFSTLVYKNTSSIGNISFAAKVGYTDGLFNLNMTAIGDIDGDGKNDVLQGCETQPTISIHLNEVNPSPFILSYNPVLGGAGTSVTITGNNFTGVTTVSFGGINAASFVVNSASSITAIVGAGGAGDVAVTNNFGTGTKAGYVFGTPPVITSISPAFAPIGASIIITGNNFSPVAANNTVFFGEVKAIVTAASLTSLSAVVPLGAGHKPVKVTVNNLTAYSPENFSVTFPGGTGGFNASSFAPPISRGNGGNGTLSDIDGDGKLDLVMTNVLNNIVVALNTSISGTISFAPNVSIPSFGYSKGPTTGDLDGDGKPDIVIFNNDSNYISVIRNTSTIGNISMGAPAKYFIGISTTSSSDAIIHDLDGDGKPDIIVANSYTISIFKNLSTNGNIILDTRIDYSVFGNPTGVVVRDLDGDGKPELIASVNGPSNVATFLNTSVPGTISFALKTNFTAGNWPIGITPSDIDGDGKLDVVIPNVNGTTVSVFRNLSTLGNLSLAASQDYSTLSGPIHASVTDMDGDGKPDILAENIYSNQSISIFKNISTLGNLAMQPRFDYSTGSNSGRSNPGDIDGDGVPDIVLFMQNGITTFYRNLLGGTAVSQICANSNTSITSNITGTTYQWQQNTGSGFNDISNNANFSGATTATLQAVNVPIGWNGYQYRCKVNATNLSIVTTLNVTNPPIVNAGPDTTICTGNSIQLLGSGGTTYSWSPATGLSNPNIANPIASPSVTTSYILTASNSGSCTANDTVIVSVIPIGTPDLSISTPVTTICSGSNVTFTAIANNGGTAPAYQWQVNGINVGTNSNTFTTSSLLNGDQVKCNLISNAVCVSSTTATSNILSMVVNTNAPASVNISTSTTAVCFGTIVTFSAVPSNGGASPSYQWQVNGVNVGTNSNTFTTSTLTNNSQVKVVLTSSLSCALPSTATSNIITMTVSPLPIANAGNDVNICTGSSTPLQASGGTFYLWSPAVGLSNPNIANPIASPVSTTAYIVTVSNGAGCIAKDTVVVSVNLPALPSVNISTSNSNICSGTAATFTATATNGGSSPVYQWMINGVNAGTNSNTFISSSLNDNDQIKVNLSSSLTCLLNNTIPSNVITMSVQQLAAPIVSLSNSLFTVTNPDTSVTYTWQIFTNTVWSNIIPSATGIVYLAPSAGEYRVKAVKGPCTVYSASQITNNVLQTAKFIYLRPNPANQIIILDSLTLSKKYETVEITDMQAKRVLPLFNIKNQITVSIDISSLIGGTYLAIIRQKDGTYTVLKFIKL